MAAYIPPYHPTVTTLTFGDASTLHDEAIPSVVIEKKDAKDPFLVTLDPDEPENPDVRALTYSSLVNLILSKIELVAPEEMVDHNSRWCIGIERVSPRLDYL